MRRVEKVTQPFYVVSLSGGKGVVRQKKERGNLSKTRLG